MTSCTSPSTTCAAFLERALSALSRRGADVRAVLTENARAYDSRAFRAVADAHAVSLERTQPYRPQINGKAERFIRILQDEWAYARSYRSNADRLRELPRWLYRYNYHRPHGGITGPSPHPACEQRERGVTMGGPFGARRVIDLRSGQAGGVATMVLPGEHTDRLLEELGNSASEVARLRSEGGVWSAEQMEPPAPVAAAG